MKKPLKPIIYILLFCIATHALCQIQSAQSGFYHDPATWVGGQVPAFFHDVVIKNGHTIIHTSNENYQCVSMKIEAGATLETLSGRLSINDTLFNEGTANFLSASTIVVNGHSNSGLKNTGTMWIGFGTQFRLGTAQTADRLFESTGTLKISPNAIGNIYGGFHILQGALIQDGGIIIQNGQGESLGSSLDPNKYQIFINASQANCTDGSIMIVNPRWPGTFSFLNDVEIAGQNLNAFTANHIFMVGDGTSTALGPLNRGINIANGNVQGDKAPLNHLLVQTGPVQTREVRSSLEPGKGLYIKGNASVSNSSDLQNWWNHNAELVIGGDIILGPGSYLTCAQQLTLGSGNGYSVSNKQIIMGLPEQFRDDTYQPAAHFNALKINNLHSDGAVEWPNDTLKVNYLHLANGDLLPHNVVQIGNPKHPYGQLVMGNGAVERNNTNNAQIIRYYSNIYSPIVPLNSDYSYFPYEVDGKKYTAQFAADNISTTGWVSIIPTVLGGSVTTIAASYQGNDAGVWVNRASRTFYDVGYSGPFAASNISMAFGNPGDFLIEENTVQNIRIFRENFLPEYTNTPSGTPQNMTVTRTGIANQMGMWGKHYFAGNSNNLLIKVRSVQSGSFGLSTTWQHNYVPDNLYGAEIMPGHIITDSRNGGNFVRSLRVNTTSQLDINTANNSYFSVSGMTDILGTLNINKGQMFSYNIGKDTTLYIGPEGMVNVNTTSLFNSGGLHVYSPTFTPNRLGFLLVEGRLNINTGLVVGGAMQVSGQGSFNLKKNANLILAPSNGNVAASTSRPTLYIKTTGNMLTEGGQISFMDPQAHGGHSLLIERNNPSAFDIRATRLLFNRSPDGNGGGFQGVTDVGYLLNTYGGAENIALGTVQINAGNPTRIVTTGAGGIFMGDSLVVNSGASFWLKNMSTQNRFAGVIDNKGSFIAQGNMIFGGTATYEAKKQIIVKKISNNAFINHPTASTGAFNVIEIDHSGLHVFFNFEFTYTIAQQLKLTRGYFLNNQNFILGTSTSQIGDLVVGAGRLLYTKEYFPLFIRWFNTSTINLGETQGLFPWATQYADRFAYVGGTPGVGGTFGFRIDEVPNGLETISPTFTDAGATMAQNYPSIWVGIPDNGFSNNFMDVRLHGGGMRVNNLSNLRIIRYSPKQIVGGTHGGVSGTLDNPILERIGMNSSQLGGGLVFGFPAGVGVKDIVSVQNGDYDNTSTWNCACLPLANSRVTINHNVIANNPNIPSHAEQLFINNSLSIEANDTLRLAREIMQLPASASLNINTGAFIWNGLGSVNTSNFAGNININGGLLSFMGQGAINSKPNNNNYFNTNGLTLTMSGGELWVNGALQLTGATKTNISGGKIFVLGARPGNESNFNVQNYSRILHIGALTASNAQVNIGGDAHIYIINPHANFGITATLQNSGIGTINLLNSNIHLGYDQYTTDLLEQNNGFQVEYLDGNFTSKFGNLIAEGGSNTGRYTVPISNMVIGGNLIVKASSEFRISQNITIPEITINGNLVNDGLFTSYNAQFVMGGKNDLVNVAQSISGTGRFRWHENNTSVFHWEPFISSLKVNNNSTGLQINVPNFSCNFLTMANGDITPLDTLNIGHKTVGIGTLTASGNGVIFGTLRRYISSQAANSVYDFPVGVMGNRRNMRLTIQPYGTIINAYIVNFMSQNPGNLGLPLAVNSLNIGATAPDGFWRLQAPNFSGYALDVELTAKNFTNIIDYTQLAIVERNDPPSPWLSQGIHQPTIGSNSTPVLKRTGVAAFGDFAVGMPGLAIPALTYWTGAVSTDWFNMANWNPGIPGASSEAIIPTGRPRYPQVSASTAVKKLSVENSATVGLDQNVQLKVGD